MVETKLIRPGNRAVDAHCPDCHHVRRIYTNADRGLAHCMYCGAEFEWLEKEGVHELPVGVMSEWMAQLAGTP